MAGPPREKRPALPRLNLPLSDRLLESLWGILIVLSVTGSAELVIGATGAQVFLLGAVTAFAWGVVEAVMDILRRALERGRQARILEGAGRASPETEKDVADALRDSIIQHLAPTDRAAIHQAILEAAKRAPAPDLHISKKDVITSVETGVTLSVSAIPLLLPFLLVSDTKAAVALSQAIAVAILFGLGAAWGRYSGQSPLRTGTVMAVLGLGLAGLLQFMNA